MTRAALTKLFILVILAFIICLPEFFMSYRVLRVKFLCVPYQPCEQGNRARKEDMKKTGEAEVRRWGVCDPCLTSGNEKWESVCTRENPSNVTDPGDLGVSWFTCEADMDMENPHGNNSLSGSEVILEVSVEVHLGGAGSLNFTLYGQYNRSSRSLHPPEEEEKEKGDDEGQGAFYCCLPVLPTSEPTNHSCCRLRLTNQTVLTAKVKEKLPWKRIQKDEWWCVFRVLWLALLCVVLLTVVTTVLGQVYQGRSCCSNKPKVCPVSCSYTGQRLNGSAPSLGNISVGEMHTETTTQQGMDLRSFGTRYWPGLSPIHEVETADVPDTLLDRDVDHQSYDITGCFNAHLHHRGHPPISSSTEEQA